MQKSAQIFLKSQCRKAHSFWVRFITADNDPVNKAFFHARIDTKIKRLAHYGKFVRTYD